jgi:hypothetical protein
MRITGGTLNFVCDELGHVLVTVKYDDFQLTARGDDMAYTLGNDMVVQIKVAYVDAKGNPATVDGEVTWASSDTNIATVDVDDADSFTAQVTPGTQIGQMQVTARADADLGNGTREIITTMDVEIVAGEAVAGTITPVGEPTPA